MDEEELPQGYWSLQLRVGEELTLIPGDNQTLWVTDVFLFLVDPESADGQGVVAACVNIGTEDIMLAELSSEATDVELLEPEVLEKEFCFYVARLRQEGESSDEDSNTDPDPDAIADAVIVQFEGFMLPMLSPDTDEEKEEKEERHAEVEPYVAMASSANSSTKNNLRFAARIYVSLFLFVSVLALLTSSMM